MNGILDEDTKAAADRFMEKLEKGGFTVARSQNDEEDYDIEKQERDSKAVEEFAETQLFKELYKDILEGIKQ